MQIGANFQILEKSCLCVANDVVSLERCPPTRGVPEATPLLSASAAFLNTKILNRPRRTKRTQDNSHQRVTTLTMTSTTMIDDDKTATMTTTKMTKKTMMMVRRTGTMTMMMTTTIYWEMPLVGLIRE